MKSLITLNLLLLQLFCTAQTWVTKPAYTGNERDDGASFTIGNKAYCGTGLSSWFAPLGDFYSFDLISQSWNLEAPLPGGMERQYATGLSSGLYGYIFGGINGNNYLNDLWRYDAGSMTWTQLTSLPGSGRSGAAGFFLDNTLYILGGKTSTSISINEVWAYDLISGSWSQKANIPVSSWRGSAAATDTLGYFAFGINEFGKYSNQLWEYEPSMDVWHQLSSSPGPAVSHSTLEELNGYLLSFGGVDSNGQHQNTLYRYGIANSNWTQLSVLPSSKRKGGMAFTYGQDFYYTTGIDGLNQRLRETWACENVLIDLPSFEVSKFKVFPNPSSSLINLKLPKDVNLESVSITIIDFTGTVQKNYAHLADSEIDISHLPTGAYMLIIKTPDISESVKLIKSP